MKTTNIISIGLSLSLFAWLVPAYATDAVKDEPCPDGSAGAMLWNQDWTGAIGIETDRINKYTAWVASGKPEPDYPGMSMIIAAGAYMARAELYAITGDYDKAEQDVRAERDTLYGSSGRNPSGDSTPAYDDSIANARLFILERQGKYADAAAGIEESGHLYFSDRRGLLLVRLGRYGDAQAWAVQQLGSPVGSYALGLVAEHEGDLAGAYTHYQDALNTLQRDHSRCDAPNVLNYSDITDIRLAMDRVLSGAGKH